MRLTYRLDDGGTSLSPVHSYLTAAGYEFPSYEEWSKSPTAPKVDSPEVQRILNLKPGDWGTEKFRRDTYDRVEKFRQENLMGGPMSPGIPGRSYGPRLPEGGTTQPSRASATGPGAAPTVQQREAAKQDRLAKQNAAKRALMEQQQIARDAAQQRYAKAQADAMRSANQIGRGTTALPTQNVGYVTVGTDGTLTRQPGGPIYGNTTKGAEPRIQPAGDWQLGGDLNSASLVITGDATRRNIQMYGRPPEGRITRTQQGMTLATPRYKPGDQFGIRVSQNWTTEDVRERQQKMIQIGILSPDAQSQRGVWGIGEAGAAQQIMGVANVYGWSFDRTLDTLLTNAQARKAAGIGADSGGAGSGPLSVTSVDYSLSSLDQARVALAAVMAAETGRKPTDAEVRKFLAQLNKKERKAPITTTTSRNQSGSYQTSVKADKSIDPTEEATRFVQTAVPGEVREYGEYQYYDILASVIGGE